MQFVVHIIICLSFYLARTSSFQNFSFPLGSLNTVVQVDSSVELGHITVDWVNDEVFYVESSPGGPDRVSAD